MAKSYRKNWILKTNNKSAKRSAKKKMRKYQDLNNYNFYRKIFDSWHISDYKSICTPHDDIIIIRKHKNK